MSLCFAFLAVCFSCRFYVYVLCFLCMVCCFGIINNNCGDAFPIEGVLVATYLLSVEALPHCRCGVANKSCMV